MIFVRFYIIVDCISAAVRAHLLAQGGARPLRERMDERDLFQRRYSALQRPTPVLPAGTVFLYLYFLLYLQMNIVRMLIVNAQIDDGRPAMSVVELTPKIQRWCSPLLSSRYVILHIFCYCRTCKLSLTGESTARTTSALWRPGCVGWMRTKILYCPCSVAPTASTRHSSGE